MNRTEITPMIAAEIHLHRHALEVWATPGQSYADRLRRMVVRSLRAPAWPECDWSDSCTQPSKYATITDVTFTSTSLDDLVDALELACPKHEGAKRCENWWHKDCDGVATVGWRHDCDLQPHNGRNDDYPAGHRCDEVMWWCTDCSKDWGTPDVRL